MLEKIDVEKIIELLNHGFEADLISFELNIPIEYVDECKKQLDKRNIKSTTSQKSKIIRKTPVQKMREQYRILSSAQTNRSETARNAI